MVRFRAAGPWVLGAATVAAFFAPLLAPAAALATRDVATFHLPLRTDLARLAAAGAPSWNPWIHGGQPLASNPNYAAFYPPTWLAFAVTPAYSLGLVAALHAALAFAGAWLLARRLGCGRGAAALGAVGFAAGGPLVGLVHSFNLLCGIAWLPWVGLATDAALAAPPRRWLRPAAGCAAALAAQLLAGEPVAALIGGIWVGCLALGRRPGARLADPGPGSGAGPGTETGGVLPLARQRALRLGTVALLAALLAGVQLLPTCYRLADSPRAGALAPERAAVWSAPPERLVELLLPRFWGDPAAADRGLWFGWRLHDKQFPYLVSIYPGLLVAVLAVGGLARRSLPRRAAWLAMIAVGLLIGLGRHNPLFEPLHRHLPLLGLVRYPEKLLLVALTALPLVATSW